MLCPKDDMNKTHMSQCYMNDKKAKSALDFQGLRPFMLHV